MALSFLASTVFSKIYYDDKNEAVTVVKLDYSSLAPSKSFTTSCEQQAGFCVR